MAINTKVVVPNKKETEYIFQIYSLYMFCWGSSSTFFWQFVERLVVFIEQTSKNDVSDDHFCFFNRLRWYVMWFVLSNVLSKEQNFENTKKDMFGNWVAASVERYDCCYTKLSDPISKKERFYLFFYRNRQNCFIFPRDIKFDCSLNLVTDKKCSSDERFAD